jgi:hypothetical protein
LHEAAFHTAISANWQSKMPIQGKKGRAFCNWKSPEIKDLAQVLQYFCRIYWADTDAWTADEAT